MAAHPERHPDGQTIEHRRRRDYSASTPTRVRTPTREPTDGHREWDRRRRHHPGPNSLVFVRHGGSRRRSDQPEARICRTDTEERQRSDSLIAVPDHKTRLEWNAASARHCRRVTPLQREFLARWLGSMMTRRGENSSGVARRRCGCRSIWPARNCSGCCVASPAPSPTPTGPTGWASRSRVAACSAGSTTPSPAGRPSWTACTRSPTTGNAAGRGPGSRKRDTGRSSHHDGVSPRAAPGGTGEERQNPAQRRGKGLVG